MARCGTTRCGKGRVVEPIRSVLWMTGEARNRRWRGVAGRRRALDRRRSWTGGPGLEKACRLERAGHVQGSGGVSSRRGSSWFRYGVSFDSARQGLVRHVDGRRGVGGRRDWRDKGGLVAGLSIELRWAGTKHGAYRVVGAAGAARDSEGQAWHVSRGGCDGSGEGLSERPGVAHDGWTGLVGRARPGPAPMMARLVDGKALG